MTRSRTQRRIALAGILAAAALGSAAPAHADKAERCDVRLERIEERFREIEARRGYEAATEWWEQRWRVYHDRCVV